MRVTLPNSILVHLFSTRGRVMGAISGITYFMAQQPLKRFDRPLMRVSLPNSILVTLIFY